MALFDLVQVIPPEDEEEPDDIDIFASAPGLIFPDDTKTMHGDDRSIIVYHSKRFGPVKLRAANPEHETERQLFAHYLWNAGIKMAELISLPFGPHWNVKGERVLELGAGGIADMIGVGLNGIIATLCGAEEVVISDYPARPVLDCIHRNTKAAIPTSLGKCYSVEGYIWGDVSSHFAARNAHSFTRIIAADCYWMPHEHENLVQSMLHMLDPSPHSRVLTIAGFHTGRQKLAGFFEVATAGGLEVQEIYEEDVNGQRKEWANERDGGKENATERKRWLVIAVLRRPQ